MKARLPNKPAAGNAGIAPRLAIGYRWPGVPELWTLARSYLAISIVCSDFSSYDPNLKCATRGLRIPSTHNFYRNHARPVNSGRNSLRHAPKFQRIIV